ncbi:MAG: hypothetical protein BECKG1743D_GA0114223_101952 [Candidatus Kentron sp. G]|nr:MAG: hypothetical protein BECKG1743E_GA0114224_101822 [Candidatus Kentron sp. G]VFN00437.1 MAG: hypothetical protein BECKG1743D_GA0114223_101952 [Candidatus Kentron sp. G]
MSFVQLLCCNDSYIVYYAMMRECWGRLTVIATQKLDERQSKVGKLFPVGRFGSIGCGSPRWISDNSHYRKSSGVDRIRLIEKACRSISGKV